MNIGKVNVQVVNHETLGRIIQIDARKVHHIFDIHDNGNITLRISEKTMEEILLFVADELAEWDAK